MSRRPSLALLTVALRTGILTPLAASAQEQVAEVVINSEMKPRAAVGLFLSPSGVKQVPEAEVIKADAGKIAVSIPYDESEIGGGTTVTAVALSREGEYALGRVASVVPAGAVDEITACPQEPAGPELAGALTAIQKLTKVRRQMRDTTRERLANILSGERLAKLRKLEKGFGLPNQPELGPELNAYELVDRISRILNALKAYEFFKNAEPQEGGE